MKNKTYKSNRLWLLRPRFNRPKELTVSPWQKWYDKAFGFVVCADSDENARWIAAGDCGDEGREAWLDPIKSTCKELKPSKTAGLIMRDFARA